jgi:ABC-type polysaccharide/polyol phosphate export permease
LVFISECINTSSKSLLSYSFLIKQLYFRVGVIPLITIITALIIHLFMVVVLIILLLSYGHMPTIYWIQFPYYLFGAVILLVGFGWLSSAILVFVRDMQQTISIFLTLFFWLTPIIWQHSNLQGRMRLFVDLNPFFYITNGYRETFITNEWFFNNLGLTIYFWGFAFILFLSGALVFQKLKPHFADVL